MKVIQPKKRISTNLQVNLRKQRYFNHTKFKLCLDYLRILFRIL